MMSGGVDSSVSAALLVEAGHHVEGFTLQTCPPSEGPDEQVYSAIRDAKRVCDTLGIKHHIIDVTEKFATEIIGRFTSEYLAGLTPNPCVYCNPQIKWGSLWDAAKSAGMERVATGHYVRLTVDDDGIPHLRQGLDPNKDQSYFLWGLPADILKITLFPLGDCEKPQTRVKAREFNLPVAEKSESQEVCFLFDDDYRNWLLKRSKELADGAMSGAMVDQSGKKVGTHNGFPLFTIGQRKGLGLGGGKLMFVTAIDPQTKQVTIGDREDLLSNRFIIERVNQFDPKPLTEQTGLSVKIRYRSQPVPARIVSIDSGRIAIVQTDQPVESVTPGQSAVFYRGDELIAGGIIVRAESGEQTG